MNIWIILGLIGAGIVFVMDYILRRKKWKENTKAEKTSLIISMCSAVVYLFAAGLGLLWGITGCGAESAIGQVIYDVTIIMAGLHGLVGLVTFIATFILRKKGKVKASIMSNIIAVIYMVLVFAINYLTDLM